MTIVVYLANMSGPTHNLNIQEYSLEELLGLFELNSYDISVDDLKRCKKKVLMLHPDKSKLESKYFLFYKKAFDVIVQFYDNQHRQNKTIQSKDLAYDPQYNNSNENTTNRKSGSTMFKDCAKKLAETEAKDIAVRALIEKYLKITSCAKIIPAIGEPKPKNGKTHNIVKIKKIMDIKNKLEFFNFKKYNLFSLMKS